MRISKAKIADLCTERTTPSKGAFEYVKPLKTTYPDMYICRGCMLFAACLLLLFVCCYFECLCADTQDVDAAGGGVEGLGFGLYGFVCKHNTVDGVQGKGAAYGRVGNNNAAWLCIYDGLRGGRGSLDAVYCTECYSSGYAVGNSIGVVIVWYKAGRFAVGGNRPPEGVVG